MHRFCKACVEGYWLTHKGYAGCPAPGCGKSVIGQGGCKTDPLCDALVAELVEANGDGSGRVHAETLDGGVATFPSTSGRGVAGSPAASSRFDRYFLGPPQSALEVAMRASGGIEPRKNERLPSLRPLYSILSLRDDRVAKNGDEDRIPFRYVAIPRNKTARDLKRALTEEYKAEGLSGEVSVHLEWADPSGGDVPYRHLIADESIPVGDVLCRLGVNGRRVTLCLTDGEDERKFFQSQ